MKKKYTTTQQIIGYTGAALIGMIVFRWYNYLSFRPLMHYWQWYIVAFTYIFCILNTALQKPMQFVTSLMFLAACMIQLFSWFGILHLPLIK